MQASSHCKIDYNEDENVVGVFLHRCNTISCRVTHKDDVSSKEVKHEEPKYRICRVKVLIYIDVKINGKRISTLEDAEVIYNCLASIKVEYF